jgi:hypothetical protein
LFLVRYSALLTNCILSNKFKKYINMSKMKKISPSYLKPVCKIIFEFVFQFLYVPKL